MSKATDKGSQGLSRNIDLLQLTLRQDRHAGVVGLRRQRMPDPTAGGEHSAPDSTVQSHQVFRRNDRYTWRNYVTNKMEFKNLKLYSTPHPAKRLFHSTVMNTSKPPFS